MSDTTILKPNKRHRAGFEGYGCDKYHLWLIVITIYNCGVWESVVVKALRYYSDGPGTDSRRCHWGFFPWYPRQNHVL